MTFEELQQEHIKLQEQLKNTSEELSSYKENYNKSLEEKNYLNEEIQKLKNVNYELFERVNSIYIKNEKENILNQNINEEVEESIPSINDVVQAFI